MQVCHQGFDALVPLFFLAMVFKTVGQITCGGQNRAKTHLWFKVLLNSGFSKLTEVNTVSYLLL